MTPADLKRLADAAASALAERDAAIVQAALEEVPQADIADATGLTQERVRQIERKGGAPRRKRGRRPKPDSD
jgi:DNA-directed RNA polymerase specialized sigma24 family protein